MSAFQLLSKTMQKKIWDMKWDRFTDIQVRSIPVIIETNKDVIISAATASGKTEAAFLPILTLIEGKAENHLKVLYVSPLKALINNQFERIERLCETSQVTIHRWHGDVDQNKKKKFIQSPAGILQITPESIESLFINRTEHLRDIFKELEFIVIDEIHAFIDKERGVQLRSLISRLERYCDQCPRIIGLSATIDNFELVKEWVNYTQPKNVEIIESKENDKELFYSLIHFQTGEDRKKPVELFEDMRELTRENKSIIFCNSRGEVEETTVFLNRLAEREKMGETYFAHHSSIDKKEREFVEKTLAHSNSPKSVVATSSLELGIDIGEIDLVVQVDSTFTVSSLKQRLGRSGRKRGSDQLIQLYTTSEDSLIQSIAVMELLLEKWIEPAEGYALPYDILFHQILSICHETNGITLEVLLLRIKSNAIFNSLETDDVSSLIEYMIEKDHLEVINGKNEVIVGLEGERVIRSKDFYAVFMTPEEYEVLEGVRKIGQLDKDFKINEGDNVILSGKLWTINLVDDKKNKIYVSKAVNGKPPVYSGGGGKLHPRILEKMMEVLCSEAEYSYINEEAVAALKNIRNKYSLRGVHPSQRIIWITRDEVLFETYTGTIISMTLIWMLRAMNINVKSHDGIGRIVLSGNHNFLQILKEIKTRQWEASELMSFVRENEYFISKFFPYLPDELRFKMHQIREIDIQGVKDYLSRFEFVTIEL